MVFTGDTGRDEHPKRPQEMDAQAYLVRRRGIEPGQLGPDRFQPDFGTVAGTGDVWAVGTAGMNYETGEPAILREDVGAREGERIAAVEPGAGWVPAGLSNAAAPAERPVVPATEADEALESNEDHMSPQASTAADQGDLERPQASTADSQPKSRVIVWKGFPKPRS